MGLLRDVPTVWVVTVVVSVQGTSRPSKNSSQSGVATEYESSEVTQVKCFRENAMLPTWGSERAIGYDLSAACNWVIPAQGRGIAQIGLAITLPPGTYARIAPRLGLGMKKFIDVGKRVVDNDNWGEVGVVLFNHSADGFLVRASDRIAQLILEQINTPDVRKVIVLGDTKRGTGGFGSIGEQSSLHSLDGFGVVKTRETSSPETNEAIAEITKFCDAICGQHDAGAFSSESLGLEI